MTCLFICAILHKKKVRNASHWPFLCHSASVWPFVHSLTYPVTLIFHWSLHPSSHCSFFSFLYMQSATALDTLLYQNTLTFILNPPAFLLWTHGRLYYSYSELVSFSLSLSLSLSLSFSLFFRIPFFTAHFHFLPVSRTQLQSQSTQADFYFLLHPSSHNQSITGSFFFDPSNPLLILFVFLPLLLESHLHFSFCLCVCVCVCVSFFHTAFVHCCCSTTFVQLSLLFYSCVS